MKLRKCIQGSSLFLCLFLLSPALRAQRAATDPPFPPFRIAGNLFYVGGSGHGAYLIATPQGLILINSNYADSTPIIRKSVEQLGFKFSDMKILLISHSHVDHSGGSWEVIKETGARYEVMEGDAENVESGNKTDYFYGDKPDIEHYPPTHVDRVLHDGDTVELGGVVLTAHLTPGHTKGTTTWTFDETEGGRVLHVVIMGGPTLNRGMQMINNPKYPDLVEDYEKGFAVLRKLPCDIPLGAHDWYFDLHPKYDRWKAGDKNAFVDPAGCKAFIDKSQAQFEAELQKQKAGETTAK